MVSDLRNNDQSCGRLDRLAEDSELRTFELNQDHLDQVIINSTELRFTHLEMDLVTAKGPVPRTSSRASTRAQSSRRAPNQKFLLPAATEQHILQLCHAG